MDSKNLRKLLARVEKLEDELRSHPLAKVGRKEVISWNGVDWFERWTLAHMRAPLA